MSRARLVLTAAALAALAARSPLRHWGATIDERIRPLPGDGLIPGERDVTTMAATIHAPPAAIYPWLAQMGFERAGWYSWDRLDRAGIPSDDQLHPEWIHVAEGDRIVSVPGRTWFEVAHAQPPHSLVLRSLNDLRGRSHDSGGPRPRAFVDARWEFFLDPQPDGGTRVLVRSGAASAPRLLTRPLDLAFWHPAHVIMQVRQLQQLRRRAEGLVAFGGAGEVRHEVAAGVR
ncbi:MAG TPA: hypothetical protein VFT50_18300 [Baekduia sp.]|nr:hypothetical protein [Baekduia sp.]